MTNQLVTPEVSIPVSQRVLPRSPRSEDTTPRSKVYTEQKIRNDYALFCGDREGFDSKKALPEVQKDLFRLYEQKATYPEDGSLIMGDPIQAWEWMLGRKWSELTPEEKRLVDENLSPEEQQEYGRLLK